MNKKLFIAGALVAAGAMLPITAGALAGAAASPTPATTFTAAPVGTATPFPVKGGDSSTTAPAPEPTVAGPKPTYSSVAVGPKTKLAPKPAAVQAAPKRCQEDDPCWDCRTMGSKSCGADPAMLGDAWASFEGSGFAKAVDPSRAFQVRYVGTSTASSNPGYWVVRSLGHPGTFHVFVIRLGV